MNQSTIASHRFGFSESTQHDLKDDPRAWVLRQFMHPTAFDASGLLDSLQGLLLTRRVLDEALRAQPAKPEMVPKEELATINPYRKELRQKNIQSLQRRWQHSIATPTPVAERWVQFWSNHFCVSATKGTMLAMVWPHENEAIRPFAFGRYKDLLRSAILHPAMLIYLDNAQSMGPQSRMGLRAGKGLNENLARELLELHTLGIHAGYTQQDVSQTAMLLTGWTVSRQTNGRSDFVPALHQPGNKVILGKTYQEGPEALDVFLTDLSRHPACAMFMASKLCRHFVTDEPSIALIEAVSKQFSKTDGDLLSTALALFRHDLTWAADNPPKFKRPEELVISAHRMFGLRLHPIEQSLAAVSAMGQLLGRAPSPQGWPDRMEEWLSPDALMKRVQWADQIGETYRDINDPRESMRLAYATDLSVSTAQAIERAESGSQALALALASPEFLRR
jgi:uncharacterized protein (DUF1800 family)